MGTIWQHAKFKISNFCKIRIPLIVAQADFTDVSVLPVIVSRLQEEQIEVRVLFCLPIITIIMITLTIHHGCRNH